METMLAIFLTVGVILWYCIDRSWEHKMDDQAEKHRQEINRLKQRQNG